MKRSITIVLILLSLSCSLYAQSSWTPIGPAQGDSYTRLYLDRSQNVLFAGTGEGFWYREMNNPNASWISRIEAGSVGRKVKALTTRPGISGSVITGRVNALFKGYIQISNDWGQTNQTVYTSNAGSVKSIQHSDSQPDIMYACTWSDTSGNPGELLKSTDGGQSWNKLTGIFHQNMTQVCVNPVSADTLYVSGDALVTRSTDGGNSWTVSANGLPAQLGVYCIKMNPFNRQSLLCSNDNGIYKTQDGGENWNQIFNVDCVNFAFNPVYPGVVAAIGFDPDNIYISYDAGENWEDITGTYTGGNLTDIVFSNDGLQLYISSNSEIYSKDITINGLEDTSKATLIRCYPNPADEQIFFEKNTPVNRIAIYNMNGQIIFYSRSISNNRIDVSGIPQGVYLMKIQTPKGESAQKIFIRHR